jgi:hypothetical protein
MEGNIDDLHFQQLRYELVMTPKFNGTTFVPNILFNFSHHQIAAAVSLSRKAQSLGA